MSLEMILKHGESQVRSHICNRDGRRSQIKNEPRLLNLIAVFISDPNRIFFRIGEWARITRQDEARIFLIPIIIGIFRCIKDQLVSALAILIFDGKLLIRSVRKGAADERIDQLDESEMAGEMSVVCDVRVVDFRAGLRKTDLLCPIQLVPWDVHPCVIP